MDRHFLAVRPAAGGWTVETGISGQLMFLSGAEAERAARALAAAFAKAGEDATVSVSDRRGAIVGTIDYHPPGAEPRREARRA